jgi:hypothetical protein
MKNWPCNIPVSGNWEITIDTAEQELEYLHRQSHWPGVL